MNIFIRTGIIPFERIPKTCSRVRIGAYFTRSGLGAIVRAAEIAHSFILFRVDSCHYVFKYILQYFKLVLEAVFLLCLMSFCVKFCP